jgi:hypothetical protein
MNTADTDTSIGLADAAQAFEALLGGPPGKEVPKEEKASEEAPAEEAEALAGEDEGEETATAPEEDAEVAPEDDTATDEDGSEEEPETEPLYTVKINGKEETVTLQEALKGYQRNVDYTRKTEAVAHERKAIEAERQQVQAERAQYAQVLTALQQQLSQGTQQEPDWDKLYNTDPLEYVRQKDLWRERQERMQAAQYEQARVQALMAQEQQKQLQTVVQEGRQKLVEAVPQWKDPKKWDADRGKLLEYGQKLGFTNEELNQTYDPRAVVALYKAMQYDNLMSNKPKPVPAKGPKVATAGSAASAPRAASDVTRAKQRLANTGKIADAASIFEKLI